MTLDEFDMKESATDSWIDPETGEIISKVIPSAIYHDSLDVVSRLVEDCGYGLTVGGVVKKRQSGIIRTNCVDCLDRTNIFQFLLNLKILNLQLFDSGLIEHSSVLTPSWASTGPVSDIVQIVESLHNNLGDRIAYQYAGTAAHRKYSSTEKSAGLMTRGREWFISFGRQYSSAFTDLDKQNGYNLFLGLYDEIFSQNQNPLKMGNIDAYIHSRPREESDDERRDSEGVLDLRLSEELNKFEQLKEIGKIKTISFN